MTSKKKNSLKGLIWLTLFFANITYAEDCKKYNQETEDRFKIFPSLETKDEAEVESANEVEVEIVESEEEAFVQIEFINLELPEVEPPLVEETPAAFTIGESKRKILGMDLSGVFSGHLKEEEIREKIEKIIIKIHKEWEFEHDEAIPNKKEPVKWLANEIYMVSKAYGIDPLVFAAIVWNESLFKADIVNFNGGGDTGLTQMTNAGLNELRGQYFKFFSERSGHKATGDLLYHLSDRYFNVMDPVKWLLWISSDQDNEEKKEALKSNMPYALAAGASLLKVYISIRGGYMGGICQYNGGGVASYRKHIQKNVNTLLQASSAFQSQNLNLIKRVDDPMIQVICLLSEDQKVCENLYKAASSK